MAKLFLNNRSELFGRLTLIEGNTQIIKVYGLGDNKRHLLLKSSNPSALSISHERPNDGMQEQKVILKATESAGATTARTVEVTVHAYINDGHGNTRDHNTPELRIQILPKLKLPAAGTEAGMLARVLLAENAGPQHRLFANMTEAKEAMQWMRHVLVNRLKFGPRYFTKNINDSENRQISNLIGIVKAGTQVEGFESYPDISADQRDLIQNTLDIANDGTHTKNEQYRTYVGHVLAIAEGRESGPDPSPTGLYAWRTGNSSSPGSNFVEFRKKGGQTFYTLTPEFQADPLQKKRKPAP